MGHFNRMLCLDVVDFCTTIMGADCVLLDEQPIVVDNITSLYRVGKRPIDSVAKEDLRIYASMQSGQYYLTAITDPLDPVKCQKTVYEPDDLTDFIEILPASLQ